MADSKIQCSASLANSKQSTEPIAFHFNVSSIEMLVQGMFGQIKFQAIFSTKQTMIIIFLLFFTVINFKSIDIKILRLQGIVTYDESLSAWKISHSRVHHSQLMLPIFNTRLQLRYQRLSKPKGHRLTEISEKLRLPRLQYVPKIGVRQWTIFLLDSIFRPVFLLSFELGKNLLAVMFTDLQSIFSDILRVTAAGRGMSLMICDFLFARMVDMDNDCRMNDFSDFLLIALTFILPDFLQRVVGFLVRLLSSSLIIGLASSYDYLVLFVHYFELTNQYTHTQKYGRQIWTKRQREIADYEVKSDQHQGVNVLSSLDYFS